MTSQQQSTTTTSHTQSTTVVLTATELSEEVWRAISELHELREAAQRDLAAVVPELQAATRALQQLTKQDISELQQSSGHLKKLTMEPVCILLGMEPKLRKCKVTGNRNRDYSDAADKLLSDPKNLLTSLISFDKDNVSNHTILVIRSYLQMKGWEPAGLARTNAACGALRRWVQAIHTYHGVAKEAAQKRERLRQLQARLVEIKSGGGATMKKGMADDAASCLIAEEEDSSMVEAAEVAPALPDHGRLLLGEEEEVPSFGSSLGEEL